MIPLSHINVQNKSWQQQFAQAITDPAELCELLELTPKLLGFDVLAQDSFPLKVTRDYLDCIEKGNVNDPLLRQVLPVDAEIKIQPGFVHDPVGDIDASPVPGLIHKYHGRVLLITTPACAIHCRYCFRRHFPYSDASANGEQLGPALEYIRKNNDINEVILSGGDPLSLSDIPLNNLIKKLEAIEHVNTLRIHSRLPVILPDRLTDDLLNLLENSRLQSVLVIHCNHPNELPEKVLAALKKSSGRRITMLNQSVLLAGINDSESTLIALNRKLFSAGVLPYYLHMLDPVAGAAHFSVTSEKALSLHEAIKSKLPGFLVPRLVQEIPNHPCKKDVK